MSVYTKGGDRGNTNLVHTKNISKSDDRVRCLGAIDELTSNLGIVKSLLREKEPDIAALIEDVQQSLITVMAAVADPNNRSYRLSPEKAAHLEKEIDRLEGLFERPKMFVLPGGCRVSAQIDAARTVARRAETAFAAVTLHHGTDNGAKAFLNRLADYLYVLARYVDALREGKVLRKNASAGSMSSGITCSAGVQTGTTAQLGKIMTDQIDESAIVQKVLDRMSAPDRITLESAKRLIDLIEKEAERRGKKAVIAVCSPDGNPIAVHVMDGAFLVSFDVAVKKAYTSVAVKMSTKELAVLAQPGGTFYGLDKMDNGKIVIFGGGMPIKVHDRIIGGLGVSGGTGEEDHSLAEYGLMHLADILGK